MRLTEAGLEVVLMQRSKPERGEYWVVPGGGVENGESLIEAAQRELLEETGLKFALTRKLYESVNPISKRVADYWVAHFLSGSPHLLPSSPAAQNSSSATGRTTATRRAGSHSRR